MKNILIVLVMVVMTVSCVKKPTIEPSSGLTEAGKYETVERLTTTETVDVPIKDGCVTKVEMDGSVIAEVISPIKILVPRNMPTSKANGLTYSFIPRNEYPNVIENKSKLYQVICFEDSRAGDYDYNDLVIHVKYQIKGNLFGLGVHPIALGSSKQVYLGCVVYVGTTEIFNGLITDPGVDCRAQYFHNQSGFINTVGKTSNFFPNNDRVAGWHEYASSSVRCWDMSKYGKSSEPVRVEWFLQVDQGLRIYALSTKYLNESFDKKGLPQGMVITNTGCEYNDKGNIICGFDWFNYPGESKELGTVYPELMRWLTSSTATYKFADIYSKTVPEGAFPAADLGLFSVKDLDFCKPEYIRN